MSVRLVYKDTAVGAEEDAAVSTTAAKEFSAPARLTDGEGVETLPVATLEWGSWILDGSRIGFDNQTVGFWSSNLSGDDCQFQQKPEITINFTKQYTSPGISLTFNPATGEFCPSITIRWYQAGSLLDQQDFSPDSPEYFCRHTVEHYNKIVITINATNLPGRYAKLSKIIFGLTRVFYRDELRSVRVTEQISLISSEVAKNLMDFTLDSKEDVEFIFQKLQPIFVYDGEILIGAFYIEDSTRRGKNLYDVSSQDAIGVLEKENVPAVMYSNKNAKEAIDEILEGKFILDMDSELETETLTGYVPEGTKREALHHIAFALRAVIDTSRTDAVRVFRPPVSNPANIPTNRTYTGSSVTTSQIVTGVKVTAHSYSTSGTGDAVEIGGTTYYDTKTVTTIDNPNITASDKKNVVEITDATLVNPSNVAAIAQAAYDYYTRRNTQKIKIVVKGEKPGDYVETMTPWDTQIIGNITTMNITVSGISAADCEVVSI